MHDKIFTFYIYFLILECPDRKYVVFGKLVEGHDVLDKIENVGDEVGRPSVTVKIISCGELLEGENYRDFFWQLFLPSHEILLIGISGS